MTTWRPSAKEIAEVNVDGSHFILAPSQQLAQSAGVQNWMSDGQVLRSILRRLRKIDPQVVHALKITDKVFDEYLDKLAAAALPSVDPAVERARADRLRGIRAVVARDNAFLSEVADVLLASDRVRAVLDVEAEEFRKNLLTEKR